MEEKKNYRVYLSGPISGYDLAERIEAFMQLEVKLRGKGVEVCNPLGQQWEQGLSTYDYMRKDIEMLLTCDAILMMDGWNRSAGCKTELDVAVAIGIDVWFETISENIKI